MMTYNLKVILQGRPEAKDTDVFLQMLQIQGCQYNALSYLKGEFHDVVHLQICAIQK